MGREQENLRAGCVPAMNVTTNLAQGFMLYFDTNSQHEALQRDPRFKRPSDQALVAVHIFVLLLYQVGYPFFFKILFHKAWQADGAALNPFTTGNPFLGTKLPGFSVGRGSGAVKGL